MQWDGQPDRSARRERIREVIFEAETPAGRAFDIALLAAIALSVVTVMLDSVRSIREAHGAMLSAIEWGFTILFTLEYGVRLWCTRDARRYALSFFGLVDFLSMIPTYISLIVAGSHYLVAIRFLRVLRIFRVLKLSSYQKESMALLSAFRAARRRIMVFLFAVITLVVVLGSLMYVIEGEHHGFSSIPTSIYWAIVTLTTVGYGDISPGTALGQTIASLLMILGYSIIVVPTGIMSIEIARGEPSGDRPACTACGADRHAADARFCCKCGTRLVPSGQAAQPDASRLG